MTALDRLRAPRAELMLQPLDECERLFGENVGVCAARTSIRRERTPSGQEAEDELGDADRLVGPVALDRRL